MKTKILFSAFFSLGFLGFSQVELSETCISNISVIADEDNSYEDWFEIRNLSGAPVDITGYGLSDNPGQPYKWVCPNYTLAAGEHKYIFASGKNRIPTIDHYESIILANQTWTYLIPTSEPAAAWRLPGTTLTGWSTGVGGIGFGDGDDGTTVATSTSVYLRRSFTLTNVADIQRLILHMDYDDGFVAYLNGVEIARANLGVTGTLTPFNTLASSHEALGYQGMPIDDFEIPYAVFSSLLVAGENVLAIQVHNTAANSTDLTSNAYLSAGFLSSAVNFSPTLPWMNLNASTAWHTNFKINSGDNLVLTNAAGVTLSNVSLTQTPLNHSNNWTGSAWCISPTPTPGALNSASCFDVVLNKPVISKPAGIYATGFKVAITTDQPNVEIRYTLNGGIPTATSPLYTDSIQIPATKVLSARCFDPAGATLPSLVEKNSFVINEAYVGLPVISISTDSLNLYDTQTGIYVLGPPDYNTNYPYFGANFWEDWERYSYIEYIATDSTQKFEGAIGLKIHGGWSRAQPQKSFRVKCRDDYGMNKIVYPLIPDKSFIGQYKDFNLRNGGNDYGGTRMRDAFMQRLTRNTHNDYMGYTPVIVFLNGEYFGEYELRETLNNDWVENNHDLPSDSASVLTENYMAFEANDGTMDNFWPMYNAITSADPLSPTFYDLADSLIDLENFADYIIAETYYGNGDWSNGQPNNIKYWHVPGKKWRMLLMDLDFGYGLYGATANDNFLIQATNNPSIHMDAICAKLLANPQFKVYFIDRYADLINTIWQQNKVQSMGNSMLNEVAPWIPRHHTRWSGNMTNFNNVMNNMLTWNSNRINGARNVVQSFFTLTGQVTYTLDVQPAGAGRIHISTIEPSELEYPWNGVYFKGVPVKITAIANPGYTFDRWSPNAMFSSNNYNAMLDITPTVNSAFTAWFTGSAITDPLEISEIMPNAENTIDGGDWFELHNTTNVDLNIGGMTVKDSSYFHTFTFPFNTIIPANGRLVVVSDTAAFHQQYPAVTNYIGPLGFNLSSNSETIFIYNQNGSVIKQATYSTSTPWPLGIDGYGRSL
ncbi:MAG: CotH kinase family protein, partial [Cryomorphaceae bacterium]|nr:CotH kinase family protein [Cryomorphaceae bacterium]